MLVRGIYYEGWRPAGKPLKERNREQFLDHVRTDIPHGNAEEVVRAVDLVRGRDIDVEIVSPHFVDPEGARLRA